MPSRGEDDRKSEVVNSRPYTKSRSRSPKGKGSRKQAGSFMSSRQKFPQAGPRAKAPVVVDEMFPEGASPYMDLDEVSKSFLCSRLQIKNLNVAKENESDKKLID